MASSLRVHTHAHAHPCAQMHMRTSSVRPGRRHAAGASDHHLRAARGRGSPTPGHDRPPQKPAWRLRQKSLPSSLDADLAVPLPAAGESRLAAAAAAASPCQRTVWTGQSGPKKKLNKKMTRGLC